MSLTPPAHFTIQITMTSDWHVGSGSGRGEIDSVVQRDTDDLPYIPAKTLTGILRDGCELVAQALDNNNRGKWHNWINVLFGDQPALLNPELYSEDREKLEFEPRPAVLAIRSAHMSSSLKQALSTQSLECALRYAEEQPNSESEQQHLAQQLNLKRQLKNAVAFMKPGVAIDSETGSAKPDYFRIEEVVRMDAVLKAEHCILDYSHTSNINADGQRVAYALLIAGAKMVDRLGGKRRRGNGKCTIIIDKQADKWLKWLQENHKTIEAPPPWQPQPLSITFTDAPPSDAIWYSVSLTITTKSPVILPARTVGNVVECLDYIPGRYFLRYLHKTLGNQFDFSRAISQGNVVLTNATIAIDGEAGRPTPYCLFGEKLSGGLQKGKGVYNRFQELDPEDLQIKSERSGYLGLFNGSQLPKHKSITLDLYTHNTIRDDVQRPTRDVGGVYSYQAIPVETTLKAALKLPKYLKKQLDSASENWWQLLNGDFRLGQSKKDQYGRVNVSADEPKKVELLPPTSDSSKLYVWLLSDVLLRNKRLNPASDPNDLRKELESQLDVKLQSPEEDELFSMMLRSRRTEAWQTRWGLPRPSMLGWQAGSCMVYRIMNGTLKPEKLAELEAKGIGDRRAEGYGQLCFNDPLLQAKLGALERQDQISPCSVERILIPPDDSSFHYARLIETAAWREAIQNRAVAIAANPDVRKEILGIKISGEDSLPPMSQLGGLRSSFMRLKSPANVGSVTGWIDALENVANRKEKWSKTSDGLQQVRLLVTNLERVWSLLDLDLDSLIITTGGVDQLKKCLWAEAVRTLIDAIIRAHKRDWENAQSEEESE